MTVPGAEGRAVGSAGKRAAATAVVLGVILALLVGAGAAWWWQSRTVADLSTRLAAAEEQLADLVAESPPSGQAPAPGEEPTPADTASPTAEHSPSPLSHTVEVQPAIVVSTRSVAGTAFLTVDYVLFLTGDEASAAAAAHGDEAPPPNDYYIVNDNPLLRELPVDPGAEVRVVASGDGAVVPEGYAMPLADWFAALAGPSGEVFRSPFYWLTLTDGVISAIEQQYLP